MLIHRSRGLLFMPLTGAAAVGRYMAHNNMFRTGKVAAATGFGLLIACVVRYAVVVFTMVGVFVASLLTHLTHPFKRNKNNAQITFMLDIIGHE